MENSHSTHLGPLLIGPKNCEAALGVSWRWLRRQAPALGLEVVQIERKAFIDAQAARAAILAHGHQDDETPEVPAAVDELAHLRAQLGKRKAVG